jgi:hypothetical protein
MRRNNGYVTIGQKTNQEGNGFLLVSGNIATAMMPMT